MQVTSDAWELATVLRPPMRLGLHISHMTRGCLCPCCPYSPGRSRLFGACEDVILMLLLLSVLARPFSRQVEVVGSLMSSVVAFTDVLSL